MNIWRLCEGAKYVTGMQLEPWRIVEAQHISSSRDLVDTREEHDLLETLLEESKPPAEKNKHYLIFTPFRYPPLKYGSRFGNTYEPSLWYGSSELETAFAEVAHYRLKFFKDACGALGYIEIPMTAFKTFIATQAGVDLTNLPFSKHTSQISDKDIYTHSQLLGTDMREAGIEAFLFYSARTRTLKKNIAAYTSDVFQKKQGEYIHEQQNWLCMTKDSYIEFTRLEMLKQERLLFSCEGA